MRRSKRQLILVHNGNSERYHLSLDLFKPDEQTDFWVHCVKFALQFYKLGTFTTSYYYTRSPKVDIEYEC